MNRKLKRFLLTLSINASMLSCKYDTPPQYFKWQPWIDYKDNNKSMLHLEPPCIYCKWWKPEREFKYLNEKYGTVFYGVEMCHTPKDMERDFSCFVNREL